MCVRVLHHRIAAAPLFTKHFEKDCNAKKTERHQSTTREEKQPSSHSIDEAKRYDCPHHIHNPNNSKDNELRRFLTRYTTRSTDAIKHTERRHRHIRSIGVDSLQR